MALVINSASNLFDFFRTLVRFLEDIDQNNKLEITKKQITSDKCFFPA